MSSYSEEMALSIEGTQIDGSSIPGYSISDDFRDDFDKLQSLENKLCRALDCLIKSRLPNELTLFKGMFMISFGVAVRSISPDGDLELYSNNCVHYGALSLKDKLFLLQVLETL